MYLQHQYENISKASVLLQVSFILFSLAKMELHLIDDVVITKHTSKPEPLATDSKL
jgi:hypothetical protein